MKLLRTLHTIRYLQPRQAFYFFWRRVIGLRAVNMAARELPARTALQWPVRNHADDSLTEQPLTFHFLNHSESFATDIDWCPQQCNRLWRYNLHYFAYLHADVSDSSKARLIDDWIGNNPQGSQPAWEPYTASLRIVNWVQYFSREGIAASDAALQSLFEQSLWLEKNLELHILANHYFENLKALCFAASFFTGGDARRWQRYVLRELPLQLDEQFFEDGGHYERSPQYHAILLEACLEIYRLAASEGGEWLQPVQAHLQSVIENGLQFLQTIVSPQQQIPLLNDSAYAVAPELAQLHNDAASLQLALPADTTAPQASIEYPQSGIYGYRHQQDWFLLDCGDIGPAYQPGHTHCDFLSYELMVAGQLLITDTGVCEYEPGPMRHHVRSTAAHNTVTVDGAEQSEIWGEFRVARRAQKQFATLEQHPARWQFSGGFRGFPALGWLQHQRDVGLELSPQGDIQAVTISDQITGAGTRQLQSYIHLHPAIRPQKRGSEWELYQGQRLLARLRCTDNSTINEQQSPWCPEFGQQISRPCLVVSCETELPASFGYTITMVS
ncbi:MAG: heparinase II/III domain-containing protein [Rickettsiales bacterium]